MMTNLPNAFRAVVEREQTPAVAKFAALADKLRTMDGQYVPLHNQVHVNSSGIGDSYQGFRNNSFGRGTFESFFGDAKVIGIAGHAYLVLPDLQYDKPAHETVWRPEIAQEARQRRSERGYLKAQEVIPLTRAGILSYMAVCDERAKEDAKNGVKIEKWEAQRRARVGANLSAALYFLNGGEPKPAKKTGASPSLVRLDEKRVPDVPRYRFYG